MEGRRLIISMVIGGMTQYLTKVQGMPTEVEEKLEKRIRRFLWDEKTHVRVNKETILAPIEMGGPIMITCRAEWAYVADALIAKHVPNNEATIDERIKINIFLQSWHTQKKDLPDDLKKMLNIAKKHTLRLEGLAFSRSIIREMPIWLHKEIENARKNLNSKECRCLREKHGVRTVGQAESLAKVTRHQNHKRRSSSREDHGCTAPFKCMTKAMELIRALPPKMFTEGVTPNGITANHWSPEPNGIATEAYTDGSCTNVNGEGPRAGAGVHFPDENIPDRSIRIPTSLKQTNQTGEIIGIKEAATIAPENVNLSIKSDSKTFIKGLTRDLQKWEDKAFVGVENANEIQATVATLRNRKALTNLTWVKGHSGIEGNEEADRLANEGRLKPHPDDIDLEVPLNMKLTGMKLTSITQSQVAERAIKIKKMRTSAYKKKLERRATVCNIGRAQACIEEVSGTTPSETLIWKSIRHKDIGRRVQFFLWMTMHDAYKVGTYWDQIPGYEHRANCQHCGVPETMEHILLECECAGQKEVWGAAEALWKKQQTVWIKPEFGTILGCGALNIRNQNGKTSPGESRLYRIIVSESAHLIWKLRNERVINQTDPLPRERIEKRWRTTIHGRYQIDCILATSRFGKKKLPTKVKKRTWGKVIHVEHLPSDEDREGIGVLVGERAMS
ncbi:RNase H-domain-containing protein [Lentinula raphanica]|nr:RNase H-domain-containing protein [Lentinula raphanica]